MYQTLHKAHDDGNYFTLTELMLEIHFPIATLRIHCILHASAPFDTHIFPSYFRRLCDRALQDP